MSLQVYDGATIYEDTPYVETDIITYNQTHYDRLAHLTGSTAPAYLTASSGAFFIIFRSDEHLNMPGFLLSWAAVTQPPSATDLPTEVPTPSPTPSPTFAPTTVFPCTQTTLLTAASALLSDGPGDYAHNADCSWTIVPVIMNAWGFAVKVQCCLLA